MTLRTAEVLQDGELYTRPLRDAKSTDVYTFAGRAGGEEWEPRFTFHGFQYVEVDGWPGDLEADAASGALVARVLHSDLERTGWFSSSDPLLDRLHENIVWGMRGNFVDVPTDCPQRDERLGWTGDIQVFAPTASFLYDSSGLLTGWLRDLAAEQLPDGTVPWFVPVIPADTMWTPQRPGAAWGDAATIVPWTLYERFGDAGVLRDQFDSARAWVDLQSEIAGPSRLWDTGFQLGDWLDPAAPPQDPAHARTDRHLVASAYFGLSARLVSRMAEVLGEREIAEDYARLADEIAEAFVRPLRSRRRADVLRRSDRLCDRPAVRAAARSAARPRRRAPGCARARGRQPHRHRVRRHAGRHRRVERARTARHGLRPAARARVPVLAVPGADGRDDRLERWDAMLPDGSVNSGSMTSFNHYALGAVADWLHRCRGPRGRRTRLPPHPVRPAPRRWAHARHRAPPHALRCRRDRLADRRGELLVRLQVPVGATGVLDLPGADPEEVGHGVHERVVVLAEEVAA